MTRLGQIVGKPLGQTLDPDEELRRQRAFSFRRPRHGEKPVLAEEGDPALRSRVRLVQRPDQRVALIAEERTRRGMQRRDQLGGMALDRRRDAPAVGLDEIHGEEIGRCHMHGRHRQRRVAGKLAEHIGLEAEIGAGASLARLDRKPPPIGEIDLVSGEPEADRHRCERDHLEPQAPSPAGPSPPCRQASSVNDGAVLCHMPETKSP